MHFRTIESIARSARLGFERAFDLGGQATKGAWGMSWRQKALKGVENCDKPGVIVKQVLIPGFPNWPAPNP
jgi:hypothetical protein